MVKQADFCLSQQWCDCQYAVEAEFLEMQINWCKMNYIPSIWKIRKGDQFG